jgi:hypothetical protein
MKKLFTILFCSLISAAAMAQPDVMRFAGTSKLGVEQFDAWQDNENDTILLKVTSLDEADITLPTMTFEGMGLPIPSFTIHGAKFALDLTTHNIVFEEQTYSETATVNGKEKTYTGSSLTAAFNGADKTFELKTTLTYGLMPLEVTYKIKAAYVEPDVTDKITSPAVSDSKTIYDLFGRKVTTMKKGQIYIVNGNKIIAK